MSEQIYLKKFSLAKVQFQCQKQFYFKQFRLARVSCLNVKRVLFQAIQIYVRLFSVISRTLLVLGGVLPLCSDALGYFRALDDWSTKY